MRNVILIIICLVSLRLSAVPAYPGMVTVILENGKTVSITMKGDEYFKYALSEDGYTLLPEGDSWKYAEKDENGNLVVSKFSLTTIEDASDELKAFKEKNPKYLRQKEYATIGKTQRRVQRIGIHNGEPITGRRRALVVLMQYTDVKLTKSHDEIDALFNEPGFSLDNAKGSVRDFYNFASAGQLDYVSDVYGPFTAQNNMRYYGQNSLRGGGDMNAIELCLEAIRNLPKDLDYSVYDNDHDGIVDNIHIIFAGYGEEAGASSNAIWSHEYPSKIVMKNEVGYNFAGYSCTPELRGNMGKKISNIGVICHELGHALGANDYYDTNYAVEGSYEGTGMWDIMASGSWNDDGRLPPNFNPYVRTHDFGWEQQIVLSKDEAITLSPHSFNPEDNVVLRINTESNNDYFLLENRQQVDFEASLPGKGLMIYHVHPNIDYLSTSNSINSTNPQGFYPVCASGSKPTSKQYGNINTNECPFPGACQVKTFSPSSNPSAKAWDGSRTIVSITGIKQLQDGSVTFNVSKDDIVIDDSTTEGDGVLETVYCDSFESGLTGYLGRVIMGRIEWCCYPNGMIVSNSDMIPAASDGKKLLMLFIGKKQGFCEAEISKINVSINPGQKYYLSFDVMASFLPTSSAPVFRFWLKDENMQLYSQTLTNVKDKWEHIEIPFISSSNSIEYGFYGNIHSGGLFVDNVKLQTVKPNSIDEALTPHSITIKQLNHNIWIKSRYSTTVDIYTIGGQQRRSFQVGADETRCISLPTGIYVVRTSDGYNNKIICY